MAIPAVSLGPDERFELVVRAEGILPLPEQVTVALRLERGEMVAMERWPGALYLETFNAFLDSLGEARAPGVQWQKAVTVFLSRTLAVVEGSGRELPIPSALFPLQPGDQVVLQVLCRGQFPELYLYPADLTAVHRDLAMEFNR
jgi:hypothetical protein